MDNTPTDIRPTLGDLPPEIILHILDELLAIDERSSYDGIDEFPGGDLDPEVEDCPLPFPGVRAAARLGMTCKRIFATTNRAIILHNIRQHHSSCLILSAKNGCVEGVAKALAYGANIDTLDYTTFAYEIDEQYGGIIHYVRAAITSNLTALHWAAFYGYADVVSLLLQKGACVHDRADVGYLNRRHDREYGPLTLSGDFEHEHCQRVMFSHTQDDVEVIETFQDGYGPDDDIDVAWNELPSMKVGANALFFALKACTDESAREAWKRSSFWANDRPIVMGDASGSRLAIARMLIDAGTSLNTRTRDGVHALHQACAYRDFDVVRFLVRELGVGANATDKNGNTALHYMAMNNFWKDQGGVCYQIQHPRQQECLITRFLLDRGVDLYQHNDEGSTAMEIGLDITDSVPSTEIYVLEHHFNNRG